MKSTLVHNGISFMYIHILNAHNLCIKSFPNTDLYQPLGDDNLK